MTKDELEKIRQSLVADAAEGLAKHHRAQGAIQLLDHLLAQLAEDDEEE